MTHEDLRYGILSPPRNWTPACLRKRGSKSAGRRRFCTSTTIFCSVPSPERHDSSISQKSLRWSPGQFGRTRRGSRSTIRGPCTRGAVHAAPVNLRCDPVGRFRVAVLRRAVPYSSTRLRAEAPRVSAFVPIPGGSGTAWRMCPEEPRAHLP